jgi:tRNA A-37 threonylcarbamoyl transferase component Bud32
MDLFYKPLNGYTQDQISIVFEHAKAVKLAFCRTDNCKVPEPISCSATGINYELISLPSSALELLQNKADLSELLCLIGRALGGLHNDQHNPKLLHGDYVLHNLFFDGECLFIIDAHPPELLGYRTDILFGDPTRDCLSLAASIVSSIGYKKSFFETNRINNYFLFFIKGYRSNRYFSKCKVGTIIRFLRDVYLMRYRSKFGFLSSLFQVIACTYWIYKFGKLSKHD